MPNNLNQNSVEAHHKLADEYLAKRDFEQAFEHYQEALKLQPNSQLIYQHLGNLKVLQRKVDESINYYDKALEINTDSTDLSYYYSHYGLSPQKSQVPQQSQKPIKNDRFPVLLDNPVGKINLLRNQRTFSFHRSGWKFAINTLKSLHNSQGILLDGFIEDTFSWQHYYQGFRPTRILEKMKQDGVFEQLATSEEKGIIPYSQPWVGFCHNPPKMPIWFQYQDSLQRIFSKDIWQKSLNHCLGLFSLSEYHAQWLRETTGKPVSALIHPTEIPEKQFDFDKFIENPHKKIIQIGWWLRKLNAITQLPIPKNNPLNLEKIKLIPKFFDKANDHVRILTGVERNIYRIKIEDIFLENTKEVDHVSNQEYDELLSQNLAFVSLYDSSANNAVIECIARATPILVNPLPAVVEYLGKDYPLYFDNLSEAAEKALNLSLIRDAHNYLKTCDTRTKLSPEYFLKSFEESEVYQKI